MQKTTAGPTVGRRQQRVAVVRTATTDRRRQQAPRRFGLLLRQGPMTVAGRKKGEGNRLGNFHERFQSSYVGSFARRVRDTDGPNDVMLLKELYRSDPERVIRLFESQPSLHSNPSALAEYVKALVKVDRLDQ
ncbi:hypothetical protein GW17_00061144, partial [Ensete ventricosum]